MLKWCLVLCLTTLCISPLFAAEYTIKLTHVVSPDTPKGKGADFLAKRVSELTKGRVEVIGRSCEIYENFYAISIERKITHSAIKAITEHAQGWLH